VTTSGKDGVLPPYRRVSAETLRLATEATGAPEYLRGLARAVRCGQTTWAQIADGTADDLPAVQAVNAVVAAKVQKLTEPAEPEQSDWDNDEPGDEPEDGNIVFREPR
jgi:hypothetical protein